MKVIPSDLAVPYCKGLKFPTVKVRSSCLQKCGILSKLPEERSQMSVHYTSRGYRIDQGVL